MFTNMYSLCYPSSDFVGHGNKLVHLELEPYQSISCNLTRIQYYNNAKNPHCHWLSEEEELELLRKHCQWRSPGCYSHKRRKNICLSFSESGNETREEVNPECRVSSNTVNFVRSSLGHHSSELKWPNFNSSGHLTISIDAKFWRGKNPSEGHFLGRGLKRPVRTFKREKGPLKRKG